MKMPETNKIHKQPIPEKLEANFKLMEERLREVDTKHFSRIYLYILAHVLITVFGIIVTVGIANFLVSLL